MYIYRSTTKFSMDILVYLFKFYISIMSIMFCLHVILYIVMLFCVMLCIHILCYALSNYEWIFYVLFTFQCNYHIFLVPLEWISIRLFDWKSLEKYCRNLWKKRKEKFYLNTQDANLGEKNIYCHLCLILVFLLLLYFANLVFPRITMI